MHLVHQHFCVCMHFKSNQTASWLLRACIDKPFGGAWVSTGKGLKFGFMDMTVSQPRKLRSRAIKTALYTCWKQKERLSKMQAITWEATHETSWPNSTKYLIFFLRPHRSRYRWLSVYEESMSEESNDGVWLNILKGYVQASCHHSLNNATEQLFY